MRPDLVLYNGVVGTLDRCAPRAEAVALAGGQIWALGDNSLRRELAPGGQAIDLGGRLALPGFVDAHVHFVEFALRRRRVDLAGVASLEEALGRVRRAVERTPAGQWVLGGGWDRNSWANARFPGREALDAISQEHPIALDSKDVHSLWVNSTALACAGIDATTVDPPGGRIVRREGSDEPAGILSEIPAKDLIWRIVPSPALEELCAAIQDATEEVWQAGVTGIHDCEDAAAFSAFQALRRRCELGLRVLMHLDVRNLDAAIQTGVRSGLGDAWVRVGGVKIFMDGALGSRTGHMLEPYIGEPDNRGIAVTSRAALRELLDKALPNGISAAVHAIGDAANRIVLDELEGAMARHPGAAGLRHRIEHVQLLAPADLPRLGRLGVIASVQPLHATSDYEMVERYWGNARGQGAYAFQSLLQSGARLAFGTDCPVEECRPLGSLYAAVARRRPDGDPAPAGWNSHERLSLAEALEAQIVGPAYAAGLEAVSGSLAPGKQADLAILSRNILDLPPEGLLEAQVEGTLVNGRLVYRAPSWS